MAIDEVDTAILRELRKDGRMSFRELGGRIGLSPTAAAAQVDRLVDDGVIAGFAARVNHAARVRS